MGLAIHNYQDSANVLPPGWIYFSSGAETGSSRPYWGWNVFLLPYMEQTPLHDGLAPNRRMLQTVCRGDVLTGTTNTLTKYGQNVCSNNDSIAPLSNRQRKCVK
ncbi:MAG: DUF1559 domain-containing protein [Planctomycetaceae bacterium]|nr:DUF1559 domain-containing protein [Planctomycetaceae bacterium]